MGLETVLGIFLSMILGLLMGYLLAKTLLSKKIAHHELEIESLSLQKEQLEVLRESFRSLEIENNTLTTQSAASKEHSARLETALQEAQSELTKVREGRFEAEKEAKSLQSEIKQREEYLQEIKNRYSSLETKHEKLLEAHQSLTEEHTELKTSLEEKQKHHEALLKQITEQKGELAKDFENLANRIFEEKNKSFTTVSKDKLDALLKPFREQIEGFQTRVNAIHDESIKGNAGLTAEIKKVLEIGLKMSDEASNLTSALKGDSQQRGAWGEAQLERTLEMSGLVEDAHYEKQSSFKDLDGKNKQTDYLIKLPDDKHIIIDSKVSLVAYDKAISAESDEAFNLAMQEHVRSVKKHIDDLASKDYTNLIGVRSPSFVLMFMPIEPAYIDALKAKKDLFSYGYDKGIVLVSHTTLIPILRTVANLWMLERSNAEAREISDKAGEIFNQVCVVAERLQKLGNTLSTVSNHYNSTVKAIAGQQGLYGKVERFGQLSSKVNKKLTDMEPSHIDFETERLSLIAEPIESEPMSDDTVSNIETGLEES
jgi:DNA recombination protein RmuC